MAPLFTIEINSGGIRTIGYTAIEELFRDEGLRALFEAEQIESCVLYCQGKRLSHLPRMTWRYLTDSIISNAATLLRTNLEQIERERRHKV